MVYVPPHDVISDGGEPDSPATVVRFSQWEQIHKVPSAREFSPEVSQSIWYGDHEYNYFFEECEETIAQIEQEDGKLSDDCKLSNLTATGLESWTRGGFLKRQRHPIETLHLNHE